jgi:hypothetical protein
VLRVCCFGKTRLRTSIFGLNVQRTCNEKNKHLQTTYVLRVMSYFDKSTHWLMCNDEDQTLYKLYICVLILCSLIIVCISSSQQNNNSLRYYVLKRPICTI